MARWSVLAFGLVVLGPAGLPGQVPPDFSKLPEAAVARWSGADALLLGKLANVTAGPVGLSNPPLRTYKLTVAPGTIFRGPEKLDKEVAVSFAIKQAAPVVFPGPEKECVIALAFVRGAWTLHHVEVSSPETIAQAKLASSIPLGWTVKDGKLLSPWAAKGKLGKGEGIACAVTGRPALLAGPGVRFEVEPVPPAVKFEFKNPDGDGEYKLTVKNVTDKEVTVPALLTDGKAIRWDESVVIRTQGKTYTLPGSTGDVSGLKPVVLKPGEAVSGTVSAFVMDGPEWPRGGYRIEFQFALGEKSATHSFYYFSTHHDPIREAVQRGLKK